MIYRVRFFDNDRESAGCHYYSNKKSAEREASMWLKDYPLGEAVVFQYPTPDSKKKVIELLNHTREDE